MKFTDKVDPKAIEDNPILATDFSQTNQTLQTFSFNDYDFKPAPTEKEKNVFAKINNMVYPQQVLYNEQPNIDEASEIEIRPINRRFD